MPTKDATGIRVKNHVYKRCKKVMRFLNARDDRTHTWESFLTLLLDLHSEIEGTK